MSIVLLLISLTVAPASQPADSVVDDLLNAATTRPAVATTRAASPTTMSSPLTMSKSDPDVRQGKITLSDGSVIPGLIATTANKPLRLWDEKAGEYHDLPLRLVASVTAQVLWEKDEPQWRFKESGSDIKVETGKTYPSRETAYKFTLTDGTTVSGGIVAPLYVTTPDNTTTYILHKRDKGDPGESLADLKYIKQIEFSAPHP
jgi:hypothetical protein